MNPSTSDSPKPADPESKPWLLISVPVIMLLMFILPYTLLRDINAWYGSFLFWTAATVVVIGINVALTRQWKD